MKAVTHWLQLTCGFMCAGPGFSGEVSEDNDKRGYFAQLDELHQPILGLRRSGEDPPLPGQVAFPIWGWGFEVRATLVPANFDLLFPNSSRVLLTRDAQARIYDTNNDILRPQKNFDGESDPSGPRMRDDDPTDSSPQGTIYDLDNPGLRRVLAGQGAIRRIRFNARSFVKYGGVRASSRLKYFVRFSIRQNGAGNANDWVVMQFGDDGWVTGDNQVAGWLAQTSIHWDLH